MTKNNPVQTRIFTNRTKPKPRRRPPPLRTKKLRPKIAVRRLKRLRRRMNRDGRPRTNGTMRMVRGPKITPEGMSFLKCAFAPPDFTDTKVQGVPDEFRGQTLLKKHRLTQETVASSGTDYYFLLLPTPGVAFWYITKTSGTPVTSTDVLLPVRYSDFSNMFPSASGSTTNAVSYRFISNHFELISTTNAMSYSGTISSFPFDAKLLNRNPALTTNGVYTISGFESINSTNVPMYSGSTHLGVYTASYLNQTDFEFEPILENTLKLPNVIEGSDFTQLDASSIGCMPGFYNCFQSRLIKLTGLTTTNSFVIKTWACVEYQLNNNSSLIDYRTLSPPLDPMAMKSYREIIHGLPIAVAAHENANFWNRVLNILRTITGYGAALPGIYGGISTGANMIVSGISDLYGEH